MPMNIFFNKNSDTQRYENISFCPIKTEQKNCQQSKINKSNRQTTQPQHFTIRPKKLSAERLKKI
jgi:hypothetical protein